MISAYTSVHTVRVLNLWINFCVFDWQENSWEINFHDHGSVVSTVIVG